jgi:hypothetical protein
MHRGVLLWEAGPLACRCLTLNNGHVEVRLLMNDIQVHCERFAQFEDAARFAIRKMHAYNAI